MMKKLINFLALALLVTILATPISVNASVVTDRLKAVEKVYPNGSRIDSYVEVIYLKKYDDYYGIESCFNGGCNAFVSYATMKIFHNGYTPGTMSLKQIGKTASTTNTTQMKSLFKKAKVGDVIRFHKGDEEYHFAIFKSDNSGGVYIDEANFGSKNKVWINHYWKWSNMKSWSMGATQVDLYRSYNYNKVNKKKAGKNLKKGAKFTYDGITYKVVSNSIKGGKVKVININKEESYNKGEVPKYVGVSNDAYNYLNKQAKKYSCDTYSKSTAEGVRYTAYFNNKYWLKYYKEHIAEEQIFLVKK